MAGMGETVRGSWSIGHFAADAVIHYLINAPAGRLHKAWLTCIEPGEIAAEGIPRRLCLPLPALARLNQAYEAFEAGLCRQFRIRYEEPAAQNSVVAYHD
jgi:hypothetical protein